jgi:diguanylate cyclase (GGDEF)-like protein
MPTPNQRTYVRVRLRLIAGFFLLIGLLIGILAWKVLTSYEDEKRTVRLQTRNFAQAMSAHVLASIHFIDLSLLGSALTIKTISKDSEISPEAIKRSLLTGHMSDNDLWIIFIDPHGRGVVASNNFPVTGISYADRPYFSAQIQNENLGLYVDGPIIGKATNRRVFALSRRVTSSRGQFLGVVAAVVDPGSFAKVFKNALFDPSLNITLSHAGGKVIARVPRFEESFALNITKSPLFEHFAIAPSGSYEAKSVIDGENRMYSYNTIDNLPLVLSVGMSSKSLTTGLVNEFFVAALGLTIILVVVLFSGNYSLRSLRRVVDSEEKHRRSNEAFQAANQALEIAQESLMRLARVDTLTGLPNRNALYDRLAHAFSGSLRNGTKIGCLYIDIDHFKQINDTLGHAGGDDLLKQFSARLQACLRQTDTFARLAGDEFIVVIEDPDQPDAARLVASKIIEAMQDPFLIEGISCSVTASIGVAIANKQTDDHDSLLRKADLALYRAKRDGKNRYQLYDAKSDVTTQIETANALEHRC